MKRSLLFLSLFSLLLSDLTRIEHSLKNDGSLAILVVGDWGRKGNYNQSLVAEQMGKVGKELDIDFVISTGDNFYDNGLTGIDDPAFEQSFSDIYTADSLQKPWFAVLGNHDYRGDVLAQLSPALRAIDNRFICMRSFAVDADIVDFFFVDTTPFVLKYWTHPKNHHYDWRGVAPRKTYMSNLLRTNGVDFYVNGHDHCLEHISSINSPLQYFTSGGGSKAWRGVYTPNADKLRFFYDGQGFISLKFTKSNANVVFYDIAGKELYKWSMAKINQALSRDAAM